MKPKEDPLKQLFDAVQQEAEPMDPEREARALERFQRELLFQRVEGEGPAFRVRDSDPDLRFDPHPDESKPHPKPRTPRS
jgi:hypothetical protein